MEGKKNKRSISDESSERLSKCQAKFMKQLRRVDQKVDQLNDCLLDMLGQSASSLEDVCSGQKKRSIVDDNNENEDDSSWMDDEVEKSMAKLDHHSQALIKQLDDENPFKSKTSERFNATDSNSSDSIISIHLAFEDEYKQILKNGWPNLKPKVKEQDPEENEPSESVSPSAKVPNSDCSTESASKKDPLDHTPVKKEVPSDHQTDIDRIDLVEKQCQRIVEKPINLIEEKTPTKPSSVPETTIKSNYFLSETADKPNPVLPETTEETCPVLPETADKPNPVLSQTDFANRQKIVLRLRSVALGTYTSLPFSSSGEETSPIKLTESKKTTIEQPKTKSAPEKTIFFAAGGSLMKAKKRIVSGESASASKKSKHPNWF